MLLDGSSLLVVCGCTLPVADSRSKDARLCAVLAGRTQAQIRRNERAPERVECTPWSRHTAHPLLAVCDCARGAADLRSEGLLLGVHSPAAHAALPSTSHFSVADCAVDAHPCRKAPLDGPG